jgi:hypothetical protein
VLLPGGDLRLRPAAAPGAGALEHAGEFGGAVIASLADGESVHEIAVTAMVTQPADGEVTLRGVSRCRLLALIGDDLPLVRAELVPEPSGGPERGERLARLLLQRYTRLCLALGRHLAGLDERADLPALTWRVTADLGLTAEQQQGFLNVPDAVTRGRLLLVAVRDLERRERFLRPWVRLRSGSQWN